MMILRLNDTLISIKHVSNWENSITPSPGSCFVHKRPVVTLLTICNQSPENGYFPKPQEICKVYKKSLSHVRLLPVYTIQVAFDYKWSRARTFKSTNIPF